MVAALPTIQHQAPLRCSLCDHGELHSMGSKDFGHSGNDHFTGTRQFADYGVAIEYFRCQGCGLMFTPAFDDWTLADFAQHVYNADYVRADPPFAGERAARNSAMVAGLWHRQKSSLRVLDYGGGTGAMATALQELGLQCDSCDPHFGKPAPAGLYPLVICFEVLEHVQHAKQCAWLQGLAAHLAPGGSVLLSTEVFDSSITAEHWYLCPRNGHISVHSPQSLQRLAAGAGLQLFSINDEMHLLRDPLRDSLRDQSCKSA